MTMSTLYFIRHAESTANAQELLASQLDFPLSEKGKRDAGRIAGVFLKDTAIHRILCSPLTRARQTADPFSRGTGIPVEIDSRLIEQNLGKFSGLPYSGLELLADYIQDRSARWDWIPDGGGESYRMMAERIRPFFEEIDGFHPDQNILIVTHAVVLRVVRGLLENTLPVYPLDIPKNGEIWKTVYQGLGEKHAIESILAGGSEETASRA